MAFSDQIKLRAWDVTEKVMHNNFQFMSIKSGNEDEIPSGIIYQSDLWAHNFSVWPPNEDYHPSFILMDWVRAKDINNNPIFLYDVVEVIDKNDGSVWEAVATWGSRGCAFCMSVDNKDSYIYFDDKGKKFNVIGNIFEDEKYYTKCLENGIIKHQ